MTVFILNKKPVKEELPSAGNQNVSPAAVVGTGEEVAATSQSTDKEKESTILMDGPLSNVYTKALDIAFSKTKTISQESQANDSIMAASIYEIRKQREAEKQEAGGNDPRDPTDTYIYVSDAESLNKLGCSQAFDDVNVALGMESIKNVVVAIEGGNFGRAADSFVKYLAKNKRVSFFATRRAALEHIKKIL